MPIYFDLEALRKEHGCVNYFETGLYDPRTDISSKKALSSGFEHVYSVELRKEWVDLGREYFKDEISSGRFHLISDDSSNMKDHFDEAILKNKTMFFLDAHVDNADIHNYKRKCPLLDELDAIKSLERKDHVILIDDLRILSEPFPWGENSYGDINFLNEIQRKLVEINPEYKFTALRGAVEYDVLVATVTSVPVRNGKGTKIYTLKNKKNALKKNEINAIKSRKFMPRLFHSASRRLNRTY